MTAVDRLALTNFRNHESLLLEPGPGFVLLSGENGTGKTNVLEAVSLLAPGRGLRGSPLAEMARTNGPGGFAISARFDGVEIGTGTLSQSPDRRLVRVNGVTSSVNSLSDWLAVLWMTPAMDRLFVGSAGERRRFLDRLVLASNPAHASNSSRYEAAMRARNKLLTDDAHPDEDWLSALEVQMAVHGHAVLEARHRTVEALRQAIVSSQDDTFPQARLILEGCNGGDLRSILRANRRRDAAAGRCLVGPHRQDMIVVHQGTGQPASRSSTGEQKALLLGLILAHADLVKKLNGRAPLLLLDEVTAHLDPRRRASLFARLDGQGQVWMTATEDFLFSDVRSEASRIHLGD